jgi:RNA polymerase sigma-70 factor (ECF subfamily)
LKSKEDSEDSVQNVFIRLYNYKKDFKSEEHLKAWLIRVTINESKRILSNNSKHATINIEKIADELYVDNIEKRDISIELMKLNPTYSTVLYLYYYEGYKAEEIAKILSKTNVAINLILSRARKKLKILLQEDFHE